MKGIKILAKIHLFFALSIPDEPVITSCSIAYTVNHRKFVSAKTIRTYGAEIKLAGVTEKMVPGAYVRHQCGYLRGAITHRRQVKAESLMNQ